MQCMTVYLGIETKLISYGLYFRLCLLFPTKRRSDRKKCGAHLPVLVFILENRVTGKVKTDVISKVSYRKKEKKNTTVKVIYFPFRKKKTTSAEQALLQSKGTCTWMRKDSHAFSHTHITTQINIYHHPYLFDTCMPFAYHFHENRVWPNRNMLSFQTLSKDKSFQNLLNVYVCVHY